MSARPVQLAMGSLRRLIGRAIARGRSFSIRLLLATIWPFVGSGSCSGTAVIDAGLTTIPTTRLFVPRDPADIPAAIVAILALVLSRRRSRNAATSPQQEFFLRRRIEAYLRRLRGERLSNEDIADRVTSEIAAVDRFVESHLGTTAAPIGPATGHDRTDPGSPRPLHFDLAHAADVDSRHPTRDATELNALLVRGRRGAPGDDAAERYPRYLTQRRRRSLEIVWRAAALEPALWSPGTSGNTSALDVPGLEEIFDRRLRSVEQLSYFVGEHSFDRHDHRLERLRTNNWRDGRLRAFEYPYLDSTFREVLPRPLIDPATRAGWLVEHNGRIEYFEPIAPGVVGVYRNLRLAPTVATGQWVSDRGEPARGTHYNLYYPAQGASVPLSRSLDLIMAGRPTFGERSLLYCDHVLALVQLDALLFGLRRRLGAPGGEAIVDALPNRSGRDRARPGYVMLGPTLTMLGGAAYGSGSRLLMRDPSGPFFDNTEVARDDLQIGDQYIVWGHMLTRLLASDAWSLENVLVVDLVSTGTGIEPDNFWVQGHGIEPRTPASYRESRRTSLQSLLRALDRATAAHHELVGNTGAHFTFGRVRVMWWRPYPECASAWCWWIPVSLYDVTNAFGPEVSYADARYLAPGAVIPNEHGRGNGYVEPVYQGSDSTQRIDHASTLLIPLSAPGHLSRGWPEALDNRARNPSYSIPGLIPVSASASFQFSDPPFLPVLRPSLRGPRS